MKQNDTGARTVNLFGLVIVAAGQHAASVFVSARHCTPGLILEGKSPQSGVELMNKY
jgi:hypothetical protein